jgi:hypothetical protein
MTMAALAWVMGATPPLAIGLDAGVKAGHMLPIKPAASNYPMRRGA